MPDTKENRLINSKLAQIKCAIKNDMLIKHNNVEWIIKRLKDINDKVVATDYVELKHAEWIGYTALHFAANVSNSDALDVLLKQGANFTAQARNGSTVLHLIIQQLLNASSASIKYTLDNSLINTVLLAHLQNKNYENPLNRDGLSHFHIACAANNLEVVRGFLQAGVFIDHTVKVDGSFFSGFSALHFAAKYCAVEATDVLLSHGANVHIKDNKGMAPLHVALERKLEFNSGIYFDQDLQDRNEQILQLLLDKEKNDSVITIDKWGLSNFHVSCTLKDSRITERFLQNYVNIDSIVSTDSPLCPGYTAAHFAALCNIDTLKLLLRRGANINIKNAKGLSAFDTCIEKYKPLDIYTILSLTPMWKSITLSDGKTKLSELVFAMRDSNQFDLFLKKLSKNFGICDSPLWPGCSPMHLAVLFAKEIVNASQQTNLEILRNLCKQNPRMLRHQDVHGYTPLHLAFRLDRELLLDQLFAFLEGYPDFADVVDEDGLSYAHIASAKNQTYLLKRLLTMGSNVNAVYRGRKSTFSPTIYPGSTALHFALANRSAEAVDILMRFGAGVHAKDANGVTPIHLLLSYDVTLGNLGNVLMSSENLRDCVVSAGVGLSHLHVASFCGINEAVIRLLSSGAYVNWRITCENAAESDGLAFLRRYEGHTPLSIAVERKNCETVKTLLKWGADVFVQQRAGVPLLYAVLEDDNVSHYLLDPFLQVVMGSEAIQARLKVEIGMTSLHLACFAVDCSLIEKSLAEEEADVDARIRSDSPILRGYTPLHVLVHVAKAWRYRDFGDVIGMLVRAGADVTLQSAKSETVIHMAYAAFEKSEKEIYSGINKLLEAQRDFNLNPTSVDGISHFHIACSLCNASVVRKFLKRGDIDVNQPIDYFHDDKPGYSALHLAVGCDVELCGVSEQLDTLDLLLRHGADALAEDYYGDHPLHECAHYGSLDVFERLVRSGADVHARNISGNTPLNYYLGSGDVTVEGIKTLLRFGCRLNTFNAVTGRGYIAEMVDVLSYTKALNLLSALTVNF